MLRALIGVFAILFFVLSGYLMAGGMLAILLHPLLVFVVFVTFSVTGALLVLYPFSVIKQAFRPGDDPENAIVAVRVWRHAERLSYLVGVMSCMLGLTITARFLDQPINSIGAKIAASLTGITLGILQGIFFRFLRARAE